jgi:hypothetical protein
MKFDFKRLKIGKFNNCQQQKNEFTFFLKSYRCKTTYAETIAISKTLIKMIGAIILKMFKIQ